ncbi:MAG: DNA processing protein DprA [Thermosynechococcus sp.]|uniref:DNA-processing protein DprA n=1 Tax=Thermosynechococcus sp. TaxID=2814275 RepID=UPI002206466A|nr:DNA-processing protein DprA [Thermosynechococcus sp.]BCX12188.1 MAG: DNA processing protein DprA [Thermosynechococcus sp.]
MVPPDAAYWYSWSQVPGLGPVLLKRLWQHFGDLKTAWQAPIAAIGQVEGIGPKLQGAIAQYRQQCQPLTLYEHHCRLNPHHWVLSDPRYPPLLREIPDPPPLLYYGGNRILEILSQPTPTVAIVGTRDPSEYAERWAHKLGYALARAGLIVVSGLAAGIDGAAHRGCLDAGGATLAVLATGVDMIYPPENRSLYYQIAERGGLLSEYPRGVGVDRPHFPRRNRIIAGLCRAVIIAEAPYKSGALITARYAAEYGRDVYVLPGHLDNHRARGALSLVNQGAHIILGEEALLEQLLGHIPPLDPPTPFSAPSLPQQQILAAIQQLSQGSDSVAFDDIVQRVSLDTGVIMAELIHLELMGCVEQQPGNRYRRIGC